MRVFLALVLLTLISYTSFAQSSVPLHVNKNLVVHSAGLPEEFLLFVPDSVTQIAFNPARANNFVTNFVYVNYLSDYNELPYYYYETNFSYNPSLEPLQMRFSKGNVYNFPDPYHRETYNSKNPTFSAIALINAEKVKWLFSFANGINNYGYNRYEATDNLYPYLDGYDKQSFGSSNINSTNKSATTMKISCIWNSNSINYSLGISGILFNQSTDYILNHNDQWDRRYYRTSPDTSGYRRVSRNSQTTENPRQGKKISLGLEWTVNSNSLDYLGFFSYQFADGNEDFYTKETIFRYDSTIVNVPPVQLNYSSYQQVRDQNAHMESSPSIFTFENYFQHSVNWITPEDNIFISLNAFYSPDQKGYNFTTNGKAITLFSGLIYADSSHADQSGNLDTKSWGYNFSAGYALRASLSDLYILTGFKVQTTYSSFEDLQGSFSNNIGGIYRTNDEKNLYGIVLPLYLNYSPAEWISIYGGINYYYYYTSSDYEQNLDTLNVMLMQQEHIRNTDLYNNQDSWTSSKSIYFGTELRHDSGLKLQFYFDEDIASVRNWNVSVGYHFQ